MKRPRAKHVAGERGGVGSTSYGGVTRVRFGGSIPRVGKSRLRERGAPLSYVGVRLAAERPLVKMTARCVGNAVLCRCPHWQTQITRLRMIDVRLRSLSHSWRKSGRGGQIRTDDILLPKQALYQAELRPVHGRKVADSTEQFKNFFNVFRNNFQSRFSSGNPCKSTPCRNDVLRPP